MKALKQGVVWAFWLTLILAGKTFAQAGVTTDQTDYAPGSSVQITGSGFAPGENVQLQVVNLTNPSDTGPEHDPWTVTSDINGNFITSWFVTSDEVGSMLQLTATGLTSGLTAQTLFSDGAPASGEGLMTVAPASVAVGSTNSLTFTFTQTGNGANGKWGSGSFATVIIPAGWTAPQTTSSNSVGYVSAAPAGTATASIASITGSGPWTITINMTTPNGGGSWTLAYNKTIAPTNSGTVSFTTATDEGGTGGAVNITNQPVVTIVAGTGTKLTFTASPSNTIAGQVMSNMVVQIEDAYGNNVSSNGAPIVLALSSNSFASGTTTINTDATGKSAFTNLVITTAANGYTIIASASGLTSATSSSFAINPATASATNSLLVANPTSIAANGTSTSAVTVTEKDAYGNSLTSSGVTPVLATTKGTLGSVTDNHNGTYSATLTSSTAVGTANVTGTISSLAMSSSASVIFTANSTMALTGSANPASRGTNVVFTAALSAVSPSTGTPTGSVRYLTNGVSASVVSLTNGIASLALSNLPHATNLVTAQYTGDANFAGSTNNLNEVINSPPSAGIANYSRPTNVTLIITITNLLTNAVDPDGDPITLTGVSARSTNNATVFIDGHYVIYQPPATNGNVMDAFNYTVSDSFGATNTGLVVITILGSPTAQSMNITGITMTNGNTLIKFAGIPGYHYYVQASTNLPPTATWVTIGTNTAGANGLFQFLDTQASNYPARYYRTASP
jgi:Invasin, domain 3/Bacterial Ig-like domain (group 3)